MHQQSSLERTNDRYRRRRTVRPAPQSLCVLLLVEFPELFGMFSVTDCDFWKITCGQKTSSRNVASVTTCPVEFSDQKRGSPVDKSVYILFLNFKPFTCIHVRTLFIQSCIALSTLRNDVPRAYKANSSTNKEKSVPYITDLTMLFILMLKRTGDRMLPCTVRAVLMTLNLLWPLNIDEIRIPLWKVVNDLWNLNPKDPKGCRVSMLYHRLFPNKRIWLERVSF